MKAVVIQHHQFETLGSNFESVLTGAGFGIETVPIYSDAPEFQLFDAPRLGQNDFVVALGGPMSANDGYLALQEEMDYLRDAAERGIRVLGVCLGAQLLSKALGGVVEPTGGYQFGLRKIWISEEGHTDPAFGKITAPLVPTLHGECFTTPSGATRLAEGFMLRRDWGYRRFDMAFRYRNAYGVQFEPQLTFDELCIWNRELASDYDLMGDRFDPGEEAARNLREFEGYYPIHGAQMAGFLKAVLALC
ncbi:MAG: type 1 glutamine amidotransferase [Dehalococcoidia bacterium]|nr:type 1 glutamine amidotransferase [Dehalococcoidia bacterium]